MPNAKWSRMGSLKSTTSTGKKTQSYIEHSNETVGYRIALVVATWLPKAPPHKGGRPTPPRAEVDALFSDAPPCVAPEAL